MSASNTATVFLLGQCLVARQLDEAALLALKKKLSSRQFNWGKFCHTASESWLLPYLYEAFEQGNLLESIPGNVATEIKLVGQLIESRNLRIRHQLLQIVRHLNLHHIQPLLLKGASYMMRPASQIQRFRMTSDIDLLVRNSSMAAAIKALETDGYSFSETLPGENGYHLDPLCKDGMPARLELHSKPLSHTCHQLISEDSAWDHVDLVQYDDLRFYLFQPEFRVLHQFAHAQIHSRDHANDRIDLRQLFDFHLMCQAYQKSLDWSQIKARLPVNNTDILDDYALLAALVFCNKAICTKPGIVDRHLHARKILANLSGDYLLAATFHWLERFSRLPKRLVSPNWYVSKYRYMLRKQ